jgi:ProQ/FINO family
MPTTADAKTPVATIWAFEDLWHAIGKLKHWRRTPAYCRAVLLHNERISLDGSPAEPIDVEAKKLATKQLAKLAAKKAPAVTKPPTKTPSPLHDRVRASLGRRG